MNYINFCQLCVFCKKGSHCFKVGLNCFDDENGELIIDSIKMMCYNFQCEFCLKISVLDFKGSCPPSCVLQLKNAVKEKKKKMREDLERLTSFVFDQ